MLRHSEGLLPGQIVKGLSKYIVTDPNKYKKHSRLTPFGQVSFISDMWQSVTLGADPLRLVPNTNPVAETVAETPGIHHQYHHCMSATKCQQLTTCRPDL